MTCGRANTRYGAIFGQVQPVDRLCALQSGTLRPENARPNDSVITAAYSCLCAVGSNVPKKEIEPGLVLCITYT